jgi:hypothetical protein
MCFPMLFVGYFRVDRPPAAVCWFALARQVPGLPLEPKSTRHLILTRVLFPLEFRGPQVRLRCCVGIGDEPSIAQRLAVLVDFTMLKANAAMKCIVRKRRTKIAYLKRLMLEAGVIDES